MTFRWETERLILRPFTENDLEAFAAYRSDPEVARYQGWDAPYSMENALIFFQFLKNLRPGIPGEWYQIAVEHKEQGRIIGDLAFHITREDARQAEFGVTFDRAYQGQGYALEALRRLLAYAFDELGLHRVFSRLDARNIASDRLMQRLGMRREAHFIQNQWWKGEWTDEYWYAILAEEYRRQG